MGTLTAKEQGFKLTGSQITANTDIRFQTLSAEALMSDGPGKIYSLSRGRHPSSGGAYFLSRTFGPGSEARRPSPRHPYSGTTHATRFVRYPPVRERTIPSSRIHDNGGAQLSVISNSAVIFRTHGSNASKLSKQAEIRMHCLNLYSTAWVVED